MKTKTANVKGSATKAVNSTKSKGNQADSEMDSMLEKFFKDEIKDIYWAEKHLVKALPKMYAAATTVALRDAIHEHGAVTQNHIVRLEEIFQLLQAIPGGKKSEAMAGIIIQCDEMILDTADGTVTRDAGIILMAQKAAHNQMASYGGLAQLADTLSLTRAASIMNQMILEEKTTDECLALIAEDHIHAEMTMEMS